MTFGVRLHVTAIKIPVWIKRGKMLIRREALNSDDPDHPYNWVLSNIGVRPEDFGIEKPDVISNGPSGF